ncbi:uncharacterized protein LOC112568380 [Pomacea canaliculata]|uniref:uncharacterized protein LOC112568380 n=1 Tax=Pomacea canaliculata TaxID=400727 RepID=UPI000D73108B|nr:uncharacterized protein LOC112568380 [Pomacea canaliculata]
MTTTHQLMAAAFYLCGLLFLLHVDSVSSISCKVCNYTNPNCNEGNVPATECCHQSNQCVTIVFNTSAYSYNIRACAHGHGSPDRCYVLGGYMNCYDYCCYDNCN